MAIMPSAGLRIPRLMEEYGKMPVDSLVESLNRIRKRLGGLLADEAVASLRGGDIRRAVEIVLDYYDRTYMFGLGRRDSTSLTIIETDSGDAAVNAALILARAPE